MMIDLSVYYTSILIVSGATLACVGLVAFLLRYWWRFVEWIKRKVCEVLP
jgi:hypothetical protein